MRDLLILFLRLGFTAFGGPAAHIAMMREEVVVKRGWLGEQEFLDLLGATNLIPGPNSTEMAIHIGYVRAGWRGMLLAGICFISPAMLNVLSLAYLYVRYSSLPEATGLLYGIKPVVHRHHCPSALVTGASSPEEFLVDRFERVGVGALPFWC